MIGWSFISTAEMAPSAKAEDGNCVIKVRAATNDNPICVSLFI